MTREKILARIRAIENAEPVAYLWFDENLDDTLDPWVAPWGGVFLPSDIIRNCDPTAYRVCFVDWCDAELHELQEELDRLPVGEES